MIVGHVQLPRGESEEIVGRSNERVGEGSEVGGGGGMEGVVEDFDLGGGGGGAGVRGRQVVDRVDVDRVRVGGGREDIYPVSHKRAFEIDQPETSGFERLSSATRGSNQNPKTIKLSSIVVVNRRRTRAASPWDQ